MDRELNALLDRVKGYVMSEAEIAAQRKSWVIGELMLVNPAMTRKEAERIYDAVSED